MSVTQQRYIDKTGNTYSAGASHGPKDSAHRAGFTSETEAKKWANKMLRKLARQSLAKDAKAHDSLKPSTLLWAAFILSLIHKLGGSTTETVGPRSYDLMTYQPPKKRW